MKLLSGFFLIIGITAIGSFYSLAQMERLARETSHFFNHPYRVTTAVLSVETNIVNIHRSLDIIALTTTEKEFEEALSSYQKHEKAAYDNFKIIGDVILGKKGKDLFNETIELFNHSKAIHKEIINLAKAGNQEKAFAIIKGKGAEHVSLVNIYINRLKAYARQRTDETLSNSIKTKETVVKSTALVFVILVGIGSVFSFFLSRVIAKEMNDRKNAEIRLKASVERETELADIVREAPIAIAFGYPDGKLENCNGAFSRLVGYSAAELQNINWSKILTPPEWLEFEYEQLNRLSPDNRSVQYEKEYIHKNGEIIPIELTVTAKFDEAGSAVHFIGFITDITERKETERQINASLTEKETLLHEIHHRVKNNMQIIASLLEMQINKHVGRDVEAALKESKGRVYAMAAIHESLYQSDKISRVNASSYIHQLSDLLAQTYLETPNRITFNIETPDLEFSISTANPLGLVLNELISNSLKYAFPDNRTGTISIRSTISTENIVELAVSDNGVGLPKDFDWTMTNTLGLSLVKNLIERQLNGSIAFKNGDGTTFTIKFKLDSE